jgi:predicted HTH transcriptional regulator
MNDGFRLSPKALADLKVIAHEEIEADLSDDELHEMGWRLLRLFSILATPSKTKTMEISEQELKALKFLSHQVHVNTRTPSVRELATALGLRSSRSGHRMLARLVKRGLITRDGEGKLNLGRPEEYEMVR